MATEGEAEEGGLVVSDLGGCSGNGGRGSFCDKRTGL